MENSSIKQNTKKDLKWSSLKENTCNEVDLNSISTDSRAKTSDPTLLKKQTT